MLLLIVNKFQIESDTDTYSLCLLLFEVNSAVIGSFDTLIFKAFLVNFDTTHLKIKH